MPSVFDYLFNRITKSGYRPQTPSSLTEQEEQTEKVETEVWERETTPVLNRKQMEAFSREEVRRALRHGAKESLSGCNLSQRETDFGRLKPEEASGKRLLFLDNPEVFRTLKSMYERIRPVDREFEKLFVAQEPDPGRRAAYAVSQMLLQFDGQSVPRIDYTDEKSLREGVPELLNQGYEAMALAKSVQGLLRDQANIWISMETGEEIQKAEARWKRLDVFMGARNAALDICSYFITEDFEKGTLLMEEDETKRRLLVNCVCSLHYVNDPFYKNIEEKPLDQVTAAQASYMKRGGDYRAFNDVKTDRLCSFLKGETPAVEVRHRPDYLDSLNMARSEQKKEAAARRKVAVSELQKQEFGKDIERSRNYGLDQKGRALRSGSAGISDHTGKHDRDADGSRLRPDRGRRL